MYKEFLVLLNLFLFRNETNCTSDKVLTCSKNSLNKTTCYCRSKIIPKPRNNTGILKCGPGQVYRCNSKFGKYKCHCQNILVPAEITYSCPEGKSLICYNNKYSEKCFCK